MSIVAADCTAIVTPDFNVTKFYNSLGQSPCHIATVLGNACNKPGDAAFTLLPLNANQPTYPGPSVANANNPCQCNTVYYSLLSACSDCQMSRVISWAYFSQNCTGTSLSLFPRPIPAGTSVPHYAYLPINAGGFFDDNSALAVGGAESFPISSIASASSTVGPESSATFTTSAINTSAGSGSANGKSTIVIGAIVEGVVGFLMLVAILGLIWFCKFRHKRAIPVPSEGQSLKSVERYSLPSVNQCSVLSSTQFSLLASPLRLQLREMTPEGV